MKGKQIEKKVRELVARSDTNCICDHVMREGSQGVWKGVRLSQDNPIERIPTEMIQDNGGAVTGRRSQAQMFANIFQDKIRDITTECAIMEGIDNGRGVVKSEEENVFSLVLIQNIMLNTKAKNSYSYDNIPMRILLDGATNLSKLRMSSTR